MIVDKAKFVSAIGVFIGSIVLLVGVYLFLERAVFLAHASSSSAPIVAVSHEYVGKGKGSVFAYVPMVEVQGAQGTTIVLKVDTFNEEPVYIIGQQMRVSCNLERGCIEDTFFAKWGTCLIDLLISLLCFMTLMVWKFGLWQPNGKITKLRLNRDTE